MEAWDKYSTAYLIFNSTAYLMFNYATAYLIFNSHSSSCSATSLFEALTSISCAAAPTFDLYFMSGRSDV